MNPGLNRVMLIGNVGVRPELRTSRSGRRVATFSVATHGWPDASRTLWHRVVVWDELGEAAGRALQPGHRVYVEGRLEGRSWRDRQGRERSVTEIIASGLVFLEDPGAAAPGPRGAAPASRLEAGTGHTPGRRAAP